MVIVAAHGGTIPDGNYFQRVSDEGELKVVAAEMANALRIVGVNRETQRALHTFLHPERYSFRELATSEHPERVSQRAWL